MTRFVTLITCLFTVVAVEAVGQTVVLSPVPATTVLEFDHDGANTDGYAIWIDGARTVVPTTTVGASKRTAFPALTLGVHDIQFTAFVTVDGIQYDSERSNTLTVRIVVIPSRPGLPRMVVVTTANAQPTNGIRVVNVEHDLRDASRNGHAGIH